MFIFPIRTPLLQPGDDVVSILTSATEILDGDIVVVSSKAVATTEGAAIDLSKKNVSSDEAFAQAIQEETARMHGRVLSHRYGVFLTELRPEGFPTGVLLSANAGLDRSNITDGFAVGWPRDPVQSVARLRKELEKQTSSQLAAGSNQNKKLPADRCPPVLSRAEGLIAVILSDSCCTPGRLGVTAFALTVSGIDPHRSMVDAPDLFGHPLKITYEAVADQLATAANAVMGNAAESTPAAIIRDHGIPFTDYEGWVPGIEPEEDLFRKMK